MRARKRGATGPRARREGDGTWDRVGCGWAKRHGLGWTRRARAGRVQRPARPPERGRDASLPQRGRKRESPGGGLLPNRNGFLFCAMLPRAAAPLIRERLAAYPAVALVGPRQCGKTTLARSLGGAYFDLEQDSERLRLDLEWRERIAGSDLVVLDEAQAWPAVFPWLRGASDADRNRTGRFLLLGSVSPSLMVQVSESLAGRLSLVELTPLLVSELENDASRRRRWLTGGYFDGGVLAPARFPQWQLDYLALLAQRDLPTWGLPARPQTTDRLLRMVAALHAQPWNASQVGQSLGLSYHTVNGYLDYLEGAFLIRRLAPYQANVRKRLVKRPKVYWRDTGLLHALLRVSEQRDLLAQPWVGASWEGFVIEQALGELAARGRAFEAWYFRTSDQHEADLVLELGGERWAVDVKLTASPGLADLARLDVCGDLIGATRRFLVSQTPRPTGDQRRGSLDLPSFLQVLGNAE
ncbi:MAG: ATP-binding protein [Gemmatimonadetes bacterium]|nr:ATP-binding protein [Gemmatimonadota bacterium]